MCCGARDSPPNSPARPAAFSTPFSTHNPCFSWHHQAGSRQSCTSIYDPGCSPPGADLTADCKDWNWTCAINDKAYYYSFTMAMVKPSRAPLLLCPAPAAGRAWTLGSH